MAEYLIQEETLKSIANAVRTKTGKTDLLNPDSMVSDLNAIAERTSSNLTANGATVTVPAGNYKVQASKSVATATQATPTISVSSAGLITASSTQTAGYVTAGTKSATQQLTVQGAQTITPGTSNKTIASGRYLTGTQTIAGDSDLKAANIKKGVNIFGVAGSFDGIELNYTVIGSTSEPQNPAENTIWINTNTTISDYMFSATQPEAKNGRVWIKFVMQGDIGLNMLKENGIYIYPSSITQYENGAWVNKVSKLRKDGKWINFSVIPSFTYTGNYAIVDDNDNAIIESSDNWKIRFLTSGTLTITDLKGAADGIDIFLVGGGGGGGGSRSECFGSGAGGGYTTTKLGQSINAGVEYPINIGGGGAGGSHNTYGGGGGTTSAFGFSAGGGGAGGPNTGGGSGGSGGGGGQGGRGGSDGGNGEHAGSTSSFGGGSGQGRTTREFAEREKTLYSGGGGAGGRAGGAGGGGAGASWGVAGTTNTGGGGGGADNWSGGSGGSGIVIIRNKRG